MSEVLRSMVEQERLAVPAFVFGRLLDPVADVRTASFRAGFSSAVGIRNVSAYTPAPQENGLFIHLGDMQAPAYLRASHVNVGGNSPPVISV